MTAELVPAVPNPAEPLAERLREAFLYEAQSAYTRAAYRRDLALWFDWCAERGLDPLNVNRGAVTRWMAERVDPKRRERPDSPATLARRVSAVSSFYQYLIGIDQADNNPAALGKNKRPKVDKRRSDTLALSPSQTEALLAAADADGPRTAALLSLMVHTGARVGEALAANVEDITQQSGHPVLPIVGKGRRKRTLPLPPPTFDRLTAYLATRADTERLPALAAGARPARPLFVTKSGRRLDRRQVTRDFKRLARRAGGSLAEVVDRMSPHVTRHSYATDLLADGAPLRDVQYAMGHASAETTERYDHGDLDPSRHPNYRRAGQLRHHAV